jgi:hypothetical protein
MGFFDEYKSLDERKAEQQTSPLFVSLTGRPNRDTIIDLDDINNLIITLNTTNDISEFIKVVSHE